MTENEIERIKKQWEIGVSQEKIVRSMPYTITTSRKILSSLKEQGVLPPRERKNGEKIVINAYKNGMTNPYEISAEYHYAVGSVKLWIGKFAPTRKDRYKHYKRHPLGETSKRVRELLDSGMSQSEIARVVGVSRQRVFSIKKEIENER